MSRYRQHRDPTGEQGTNDRASHQFLNVFREIRDALSYEEYEVLECLVVGATLREIADGGLMSLPQVKQLRDTALAKLHAQQRRAKVSEYQGLEMDRAIAAADWNASEWSVQLTGGAGLTRTGSFRSFCPQCDRNVPPALSRGEWRGRARTYCSNACRQRAYRKRQAARRAVERLHEG
ncbi:hypothetical protein [Nocardia gipuzkoensis]|uniref:hypothetical protein n=1 Tax=Nocardia gipuzkoensis TaxID=2749991 RepID=UPI00237DA857|nr:hypothetical protein [Nocardia gipuzkoensis]MDE1674330.1 hypothetical protein [Nocardia gipuzkoensis]